MLPKKGRTGSCSVLLLPYEEKQGADFDQAAFSPGQLLNDEKRNAPIGGTCPKKKKERNDCGEKKTTQLRRRKRIHCSNVVFLEDHVTSKLRAQGVVGEATQKEELGRAALTALEHLGKKKNQKKSRKRAKRKGPRQTMSDVAPRPPPPGDKRGGGEGGGSSTGGGGRRLEGGGRGRCGGIGGGGR